MIADIIKHGPTVKEFHLRREDGGVMPDWQAGAHIVLHFAGAGGASHENHYSLIGAPGPAHVYRIAVQREEQGRGGSRWLHDEATVGSRVGVSGPFNSFPLAVGESADSPRVLLIAGGIGITPLISMAHALGAGGRAVALHYLARNPDRLVLLDELRAIPHLSLMLHMSQESGRTDLASLLGAYRAGDAFYACGPASLLQALAAAAARLGWPAGAMHFESFGQRAHADDRALTVELSLSQMTVEVAPGTSILDALIAADVFVSYDCKRGECASCFTPVLEGEAVHRDVCLTPAMRAQGMCTCVSWARGPRLVLDL
ncbi:PDR/VanB family oxidoreductase [Pseudoduganella sp. UC29_106]|uniref:PDR/VanB family oxidoreductase n=1 Tax=Pseudoduganella sp. UC29_106 TaxID=3374553 RepID=UPI0037576C64